MPAKTLTVSGLIDTYAQPIADAVTLDHTEYDRTPDGFASLLRDTADQLSAIDQTRDWLEEAASGLDAIARLGDDGDRTQRLLKGIDSALYNAKGELELC